MKVWLTRDSTSELGHFWLWKHRPNEKEIATPSMSSAGLYESDIRAMGCTKKLPTGKQVLVVNLSLK